MSLVADLSERSRERELLDLGVPEAEAARSLADLRLVNRFLGGRRGLLRAARPYLSDGMRVLDVGCGSADLTSLLAGCARRVMAVGVDLKLAHLREAPPSVRPVVADVRALPFASRSFDVVAASLFLHHFDDGELEDVIRALFALARRALVVNDLRRAQLPLVFGRLLFPLLFRSPVSVKDGLVSIRRGFRPDELRAALTRAGLPRARLGRSFPYRLVAVAEVP